MSHYIQISERSLEMIFRHCFLTLLLFLIPVQLYAGTVFKFGHILKKTTAHHQNLVWAQQTIKEKFGNRYNLEVYPEGSLGKTDLQVVEGFKTGTTNMAYLTCGHLIELYAPLAIASGPFVFKNFDHWKAFGKSDLFTELVAGLRQQTGINALGLAYYGERHVTTKKPLGPSLSLEGLLIRVPSIPVSIQTFRLLGAKPVPIPFHEVYQALQDGVVQAQENPLPAIKAMKFYEVTPVINLTAHITDAQLIVVKDQFWQTIPADDRTQLAEIFKTVGERVTADVRAEETRLHEEFKQMGVTINPVDRSRYIDTIRVYHLDDKTFPWKSDVYRKIQRLH
jgi:tripartite ATP-independent transporter DctP family solute receptor